MTIGYATSRIYGLTLLPILSDEGIHILRATGVWRGELWNSLVDGKFLQVWLTASVVPWATGPL